MTVIHALKWSFLSELAAKSFQPITFLILARLLTPEDFGVMSAALMVIAFSQIFWDAGMGKALIQRQTDIEAAADAAFWVNITLGILIAGLLYLLAQPIALTFFQDNRVTAVLQVMTVQVILGALSSVQTALLQKEMGFRKLFWVRLATVSLPGLASIPLAWNGMGYWALVAGTLTGQAVQTTMLWRMSHWRPSGTFQPGLAKEMGRFGAWVGMTGLLAWFYIWADSLVVGMYLGSHELGLYQIGSQFAAMIFAILLGPIVPVFYSHLSGMRADREKIRQVARKAIKMIAFLSIPLALVIFSLASPVTEALFGSRWHGVELIIGAMALVHGFSWVIGMNGEVYRALGKPSHETLMSAAPMLIYLVGYLISIQYGLEVFLWTRLGLAITAVLLQLFFIGAVLSIPIMPIIIYISIIFISCAVPLWGVSYLFMQIEEDSLRRFIMGGATNIAIATTVLYVLERNGILRELKWIFGDQESQDK
ncbi:MAG: lipopolysaccharide biosynthesis protein [Desulfobulbus sp.]|nr:lipopolysaccharide biosynthesis protein [Desulfobulbus sp.]